MSAYVLGGGVAGIAAAFALRARGHEVTLLEARGWLGGRAFSRPDARLAGDLDNGPHVLLGCYSEFRTLLRRIGTEDGFARPEALRVRFRDPGGRAGELRLPALHPVLGFPLGALRCRPLTLGGRLRLVCGGLAALLPVRATQPLAAWLRRHHQDGDPSRYFWTPLCRAVMNADPAEVSAKLFLATLRRALGSGARGMAIWAAARPWQELLGAPAERALRAAGVSVRGHARVVSATCAEGRVQTLHLGDGETLALGRDQTVVSALPWHGFARLFPGACGPATARLEGAPIVTAHFTLPATAAPRDEGPIVALVDGAPFHFLCRRPGDAAERFALLSGGDPGLGAAPAPEIEAAARAQLRRHYPEADAAAGVVRVVREARATAKFTPEAAEARVAPGPVPGLANLLVCGDWTATGLPSTLEGAALSARMACG